MDNCQMLPAQPPRRMNTYQGGHPHNQSHSQQLICSSCPTQQAIGSLNRAIAPSERIEALKSALTTFSHSNVDVHDYEISLGADKALCLKLGYAVVTSSSLSEDIRLICQCLIQLYQCSLDQRKRSFRSVGATELVPLLIQVWMNCPPMKVDWETERILLPMVQVLRIYAKLESAKSMLIRYNQGVWLGRVLQFTLHSLENSLGASSPLTTEFLGLVKDLTFRSHAIEKDTLLHVEGDILMRILCFCCTNTIESNPKLTEWFTAVVWNLALDKSGSRRLLQQDERQNLFVAKGLLNVLKTNGKDSNNNQSTIISKIKRNATSAIGNMVADPQTQEFLFMYENREPPLEIVPTFMRLVEHDSDSIVRRRAMRTIRCLVSSTQPQTKVCIEKEDIVSFLVDTIARNVSEDDDNDRDMQMQACQTVILLVDSLDHSDWPRLETALLQRIETTTDTKLTLATCRCLVECIMKSPWRRGPSCFSEMFWKRIETTVSISAETHDCISKLLLELANLEKQAAESPTSAGRPSPLTSTAIVNTLTTLLSRAGSNCELSRNHALDVVLLLVQKESNKRPLAENEGLLSGLVNLCLLQPAPKNRDSAKQLILDLVPEL